MDNELSKAGSNIVNICSRLMPSETVTIVTDNETLKIGEIIREFAGIVTKKVNFHILEDYAERPLTAIPKKLAKDVKNSDVTYYAAQSKPGELQKFRFPLVDLAKSSGREIHMPNIDETIMKSGMQADYYKIASLSYLISGIAIKSKAAKVTTPGGTNLNATFSDKLRWIPDTGLLWYKGMWGNLPAGEVFTCPNSIDGIMVVDGTLGDFFCEKYGDLEKTPISIPIKDSRAEIENISCENEELLNEFKHYLRQDAYANRVGEFACGTNISLTSLIGNLLQDEKYPGVHVAFGSPYPQSTGADWESEGHVDGIMKRCSLWFDNIQILEDGRFKEKDILTFE